MGGVDRDEVAGPSRGAASDTRAGHLSATRARAEGRASREAGGSRQRRTADWAARTRGCGTRRRPRLDPNDQDGRPNRHGSDRMGRRREAQCARGGALAWPVARSVGAVNRLSATSTARCSASSDKTVSVTGRVVPCGIPGTNNPPGRRGVVRAESSGPSLASGHHRVAYEGAGRARSRRQPSGLTVPGVSSQW